MRSIDPENIVIYAIGNVNLTGQQAARARELGATHVYKHPRDQTALPKYIIAELAKRGYRAKQIGHTTFKTSTWGLIPTRDEIAGE